MKHRKKLSGSPQKTFTFLIRGEYVVGASLFSFFSAFNVYAISGVAATILQPGGNSHEGKAKDIKDTSPCTVKLLNQP